MKREDYQRSHSSALREFLRSPAGQELLPTLADMRGSIRGGNDSHQAVCSAMDISGFERCMTAIATLMHPPKETTPVEQSYGVKEEKKP